MIREFHKRYEINSFLVNFQKKLGLYSLLNILQDTAWTHATNQGHGHEKTWGQGAFWVLTRQGLQMSVWPDWGHEIEVRTWIREPQGPYAIRDFEIFLVKDSRKIGESSTSYLMLDAETRKPIRGDLKELASWSNPGKSVGTEAAKLALREDLPEISKFQVRNSDLDVNRHVNNTKYAQWVLDSLPVESHSKFRLLGYGVNFLAETKSEDVIRVHSGEPEEVQAGRFQRQFQGFRANDGKTAFVSTLTFESN